MSLDAKKNVGAPAYNAEELITVVYDFSVDGGSVADYDVLENTGTDDMVVELDHIHVETAVTSAGALVADLGKGDGGTEFVSDVGKATLAADAIVNADTAGTKVVLSTNEKVVLGIEAAAATAGKFYMVFKIKRARFNT